jgi:hypothetical protein
MLLGLSLVLTLLFLDECGPHFLVGIEHRLQFILGCVFVAFRFGVLFLVNGSGKKDINNRKHAFVGFELRVLIEVLNDLVHELLVVLFSGLVLPKYLKLRGLLP